MIALYPVPTVGRSIDQNEIEGTVGLRLPVAVGANTALTIVTAFSDYQPSVQQSIGYSLRF